MRSIWCKTMLVSLVSQSGPNIHATIPSYFVERLVILAQPKDPSHPLQRPPSNINCKVGNRPHANFKSIEWLFLNVWTKRPRSRLDQHLQKLQAWYHLEGTPLEAPGQLVDGAAKNSNIESQTIHAQTHTHTHCLNNSNKFNMLSFFTYQCDDRQEVDGSYVSSTPAISPCTPLPCGLCSVACAVTSCSTGVNCWARHPWCQLR